MKDTLKRRALFRLVLSAVLALCAMLVAVTAIFARYRTTSRSAGQVNMEYAYASDSVWLLANARDAQGQFTNAPVADPQGVYYRSPDNWTLISENKTVYQLGFLLSNEHQIGHPAAFDQDVFLEVFVSEGIDSAEDLILQLGTDTGAFLAEGSAVAEDSALYLSYGPGWIYRFTNASGEPITWRLAGNTASYVPMTITVWGAFDYPGAFTVIATGLPV